GFPIVMCFYGVGNHGGGPTRRSIQAILDAMNSDMAARPIFSSPQRFFEQAVRHTPTWPVVRDELQHHSRGCYTALSRVKRENRFAEHALARAERFAALAHVLCGAPNQQEALREAWQGVLFNQFHDILPGSSIFEVYRDAFQEYEAVRATLSSILHAALSRIGVAMERRGSKHGRTLVAYNPLAWPRIAIIEIPVIDMVSATGPGLLDERSGTVQVTHSGSYLIPVDVAAMSVAPISAETAIAAGKALVRSPNALQVVERDTDISLENERIYCVIDKHTGYLKSVKNKESGVEGLSGPGNRILLFGDDPKKFPPWEIDPEYLNKPIPVDDACKSIKVIERGPLRCGVEVIHIHDRSTFVQRIFLQAGDDLLRCSMDVDWHQQKTLFKLGFPVAIAGEDVVSDIPYACIPRPVAPKTPYEKARWEYSCHKWIDVSDGKNGVGLLNDCKYGFSMAGNEIRLTVLNGPVYAGYAKETMFVNRDDPSIPEYVDQFRHENIQYAVYVHRGDWREGTWKKAIEFNDPVVPHVVDITSEAPPDANLDVFRGLVSCAPDHVVVTAFKVWEDEPNPAWPSTFIARIVEMAGRGPVEATITLSRQLKVIKAELVDLLELNAVPSRDAKLSCNEITIEMRPHEIATLRIKIDRGA
ncbi:MAG: glycoside hydrolase family 38 C-terminal domain-containing protein, partial [Candidatus Sigynarchaeota archaeon]